MLKRIIISTRPQFWVFSVLSGLVGLWVANSNPPIWKMFVVVVILCAGSGLAEIVNDYIDRSTDTYQTVKKFLHISISGGSGVLEYGGLNSIEFYLTTLLLTIISIGFPILLSPNTVVLSMFGLLLAYGYSIQPLSFKTRGFWGPLSMAMGRGLVAFHIGWTAVANPNWLSISIGSFLTVISFGTTTISYLADFLEDSQLHIQTFPVKSGFTNAAKWSSVSILGSILVIVFLHIEYGVRLNSLIYLLWFLGFSLSLLLWNMKKPVINQISKLQILGMLVFITGILMFV